VPGLGTSFGRGGATTALNDLANADCILIEGSSMAEAHPVGFRWVMKAKERGATIIHVDPRFSRTSALADLWVPIRSGSDICFLGALIRYVLENEAFFREYVVHYTNASNLLTEEFRDVEHGAGFFSGWQEEGQYYDHESWAFAQVPGTSTPERDPTLEHPRCVFQQLRRHYQRYTPEMVEQVCGIPPELFHKVAETLTRNSGPERTSAFCYAVGWTHQSKGVQIIRAAAVLQLLLGNIGRPGGGIMALRGHASIQGSTDIPTLYDTLPGYLSMPSASGEMNDLAGYCKKYTQETGLWHETPKYIVSLLKAYYGARATKENDYGYGWLPKLTKDHSHFEYVMKMADHHLDGYFVMGQNPAVGSQNARLQRQALGRLKWLVVRDLVEIETASFWYASPEIERGEMKTEDIATEVFLFPAASHVEKEGAFTNTQRLLQWREKAINPPGDARSETWFIHQLAKRLIARAQASTDPMDEPLRALDWWYPENEEGEAEATAVLAEINGWRTPPELEQTPGVVHGRDCVGRPHHGAQLDDYLQLKDDGSTAAGCWIYTGCYGSDEVNKCHQRTPHGEYGHGWGFAWPSDRRIIYNRASARPDGQPWSERKKLVWWDAAEKKWTGLDVPDFPKDKAPDYAPPAGAKGLAAIAGDEPFMLHADGRGWLYVAKGLEDGPMPTHYEPLESPVRNALYRRQTNPGVKWFSRPDNKFSPPDDPRFPYVLTTFRLTEHHTCGGMSRFLPHLNELQPELFLEISPELAAELPVENGSYVVVATLRGAVEARALVSRRTRPLTLDGGRLLHQVSISFHWGYSGPSKGGIVNDLIAISGEPNVTIMESKALSCTVIAGRLPEGAAGHEFLEKISPPGDPILEHPEQLPPGYPYKGKVGSEHGQQGQPQ
jgi:formate dehydrogenase major subunit